MNATDTRTIVAFWTVGGAVLAIALTGYHMWADRRQKRALAEYERARSRRTDRFKAAEMARDISRERRCAFNDLEQARLEMQAALTVALRNQQVIDEFQKEVGR